jgi:GNAT superfamily N-acetyltransferase
MADARVTIRDATVDDVDVVFRFIEAMAEFEGRRAALQATPERIREALFGRERRSSVLLAEVDGRAVGFASYFRTYSTFLGRPGIWLDDLYVDAAARGSGIGTALLRHLARVASASGCGRIEWTAGADNQRGLEFYRRHGASVRDHVRRCRLDQEAIASLAAGPGPSRSA